MKDKLLPKRAKANEPVQQELETRGTFHGLRSPSERDRGYVELSPTIPPYPKPLRGKHGGFTALQKYECWAALVADPTLDPSHAKTFYRKHRKAIRSIQAKPRGTYDNTPVEKVEAPDLRAQYEHDILVWRRECKHHHHLVQGARALWERGLAPRKFCAEHPDVFDGMTPKPIPTQPVEPEEARTAPKLDGRTGIRKEATAKARALATIDKRMAEEQRKAKAAKAAKAAKPAPVMRHPLPTFSISAADDTSALNQASPCDLCRMMITKSWNRK